MGIFKACDVRGIYPDEINEEKIYKIGRAVGTITNSGKIIVGGDVRLSTETTPVLCRAIQLPFVMTQHPCSLSA